MDFITGLPRSCRQHDSIWVIVDRMTKSAHFLLVKTTHTAEDYAKLYLQEVVRLHGVLVMNGVELLLVSEVRETRPRPYFD